MDIYVRHVVRMDCLSTFSFRADMHDMLEHVQYTSGCKTGQIATDSATNVGR